MIVGQTPDGIHPTTSDAPQDESFRLAENGKKPLPTVSTRGVFSNSVEPVNVQVRHLGVELTTETVWSRLPTRITPRPDRQPPKEILRDIAADFQPGSLTAIIGASGSGKTTLLDALSDRLTSRARISQGTATFNSHARVHDVRHAYVTQQDVLLPTLTVRETLRYAAELRLLSSVTALERRELVEDVISELGLQKCANTRIGNSQKRGCSGGERRRVSIGVQLLANPSLLFLDEPTTGLDAANAFQLVSTLRDMAHRGRTIIMTIHQPRSEIWSLLDNLLVLADGGLVFSGPISEALPWFETNGFHKPPFTNPADFIIDISSIDYRSPQLEEESTIRINGLKSAWMNESQRRFLQPVNTGCPLLERSSQRNTSQHRSQLQQLRVLTKRTIKVTYRDPLGMVAFIIEAVIMGLAVGYMFYDLGRDQVGIRSRQGCLYVAASLQGYLVLIFETYRMTLDMPIFDREASERCVSPLAFVFSHRLARLLTEDLPVPVIFSVLIYFMTGLDRQVDKFFIFFAITLLNHYIAVVCATACVVISRNFAPASLIASLIYTLQSLASGMIVQIETIPVYVRWTRWITYMFYTFSAYIGNEFQGSFYECPFQNGQSDPRCTRYSGDFIIKSLGFPQNWTGIAIACMVAFVVFFVFFSIIGLQYLKPTSIANARAPDAQRKVSPSLEMMAQQSIAKARRLPIKLEQLSLTLRTKSLKRFRASPTEKIIIKPINAEFQPGVLNVIIGPSGSGKSSLLNAIGRRLQDSASITYHQSGVMKVDGRELSDLTFRSMCSYLRQDDELLLPAMTVRETLRYAALLRLSQNMTVHDKHQRAEEILLKLGLKGCADTLIGNESFRGISAGEKRRVSLAIQILTDPQVLLVDEPTSGLDAFTANSIVHLLQGLAEEGRTIIMAIHQPRSDLYGLFGNLLLLSHEGSPAYCGPAKDMVDYLRECGHDCLSQTNPADFALDIVTDLSQHGSRGDMVESGDRVQRLIELWNQRSILAQQEVAESNHGQSRVQGTSRDCIDSTSENRQSLESPAELTSFVRDRTPLYTSLPLLVRRAIANTCRQPQLVLARIMQSSGVAIIFTLFFAHLGHDYLSIQTRLGLFQQLGGFYIIGMLTNVAIYPSERDVAYREIGDGAYSLDSFLASYTIVELPFEIINALFFGILAVFAIGLPRTAVTYFVASLACFSGLSCGESLGIMFNTLFSHTGFAINLMGVILALANSMAGILSLDMPSLFEYLNYLSPIRYQVRGVAYYSMRGLSFDCNFDNGTCPITTGEQALKLYKFDEHPLVSVVGMGACVVVYRLLAWALLVMVRRGTTG
ncbi:Hypothetical protein NCS54_00751300 [Fusarium falciforme]|uniref:Hypothetical protein n=1 Tax=Fusarium falciforme TaxID=195108 RepID=UPI0022FFE5EE|nr:Hypothetical protein NCS54_00751300 [Fusarium falciforme]WAO90102.1 Hypothetical protein NCS54_00751300 [Fusarium falciforme]